MDNNIQYFYEPLTNQIITCREDDLVKAFEEINEKIKNGEEKNVNVKDFIKTLQNE